MPLALPPVIGHRGAAAHAPENTLASFAKAAELGCAMVEFDVRLSIDDVPVVFHDDTLKRILGVFGQVRLKTGAQLQALGVPTLAEVLALCAGRGMGVNVELKPDRGREGRTAQVALAEARRLWPAELPPPLVSSFSLTAMEVAAETAPDWPRGLLVERLPADWRNLVKRLGCASVHASFRHLSPATVQAAHAEGVAVLAYTVNDPAIALSLWNRGVDAVFSDDPGPLLTAHAGR